MRLNRLTATLSLAGGALAQARAPEDRESPAVVSKGYIIEYTQASLRKRQEEVANTPGVEVVKSFDSNLFAGVSVETEDFNIDTLAALPDVVKVWLNEYVELAPVDIKIPDEAASALNYNIHNATGVNRLHELGILGKGAKVGVVDTGIEYTHPALGSGIGPGFKVAGGYDFVGDGLTLDNPDEDPIDTQGHGTHVAGTIAGKTANWQGVAPEATLYAYKVFASGGGTTIDVLLEAFLHAYNDGVDIITASIGSAGGWSDNAWGELASRLVDEGVVVTISAGNSGSAGPFYGSSGSSGKNVLAIASSTTEVFPTFPYLTTVTKDGEAETTKNLYVPHGLPFPTTVKGWPIVSLSNDTTIANEACTPYPAGTPRLTGRLPLIRRGGCSFDIKLANLEALGATFVLFYNTDEPITLPSNSRVNSRAALIAKEAGVAIIETIKAGAAVTAEFLGNSDEIYAVQYEGGGRPSAFTSWGGLYDLQIKPDVAAPGGDIYSAWVGKNYRVISGTSMACPYVAGVAALWIGQHGGRSVHGKGWAKELHQRIVSSGTTLPWSDGTPKDFGGVPASVLQIGNGLVNGWKVVQYDTRLEFEKIALNDTRYFSRYHDVSVINDGEEPITYTWSVEHAAGIESYGWLPSGDGTSGFRLKTYAELQPSTFEVEVSLPKAFTLQPGESKTVSVNFRNPDTLGWNASSLPLYSGKVFVIGSNGDILSVPFSGVGADLRNTLKLSHPGFPVSYSGPNSVSIERNASYSFDLARQYYPRIETKYSWGSREIRWDIFEAGWTERQWKYPPVVGENGYVGSATSWIYTYAAFEPIFGDNPEDVFSFPVRNTVRHTATGRSRYSWFGKLANGTQIAPGRYNFRFAALKPFGRPEAADNWDVYKTPQIEVTGQY